MMHQIYYKINLNKASNRLDQFALKQRRRKMILIGFYFFVVVVISAVAIFKTAQSHSRISGMRAELQQIEDEINRLQTSSEHLSPQDIYTLAELANGRLTWTEKLDVLGRILPKDVTLTGLDYDYQINTLQIKGITKVNPRMKDLDLVTSIIDIIKNNPDFSKGFIDIKFGGSDRIKHQGQEIISFQIACLVG